MSRFRFFEGAKRRKKKHPTKVRFRKGSFVLVFFFTTYFEVFTWYLTK